MYYTPTDFGGDSSSHFPYRAWTNRCAECPTHAGGYTAGASASPWMTNHH